MSHGKKMGQKNVKKIIFCPHAFALFPGQAIQVVSCYAGFELGTPLNGWLVGNVSVTGVVNAQPTFNLAGPVNQYSGTGYGIARLARHHGMVSVEILVKLD